VKPRADQSGEGLKEKYHNRQRPLTTNIGEGIGKETRDGNKQRV
jgi:hypothetical protein